MRAFRLFAQLAIYYVVVFGGAWLVIHSFPDLASYLPIVQNLGQSLGWMATAIIGALLTALPVSWVYMGTRSAEEYDQSMISSILILPSVVTSIVIVVQSSLALAFALGGIAGAVRFKNSLKSSGDALYILLSVGIGLASGIGAVELAMVMSIAFNLCFVTLWISEYGERAGMKRYMSDFDPSDAAAAEAASAAIVPPSQPPT